MWWFSHKSCLPLATPWTVPGSSVHGVFPGKNTRMGCHFLLQGVFLTQYHTQVSWIADGFFTDWATRETHELSGKPIIYNKYMYISESLVCVYKTESLCCTPETNTTLLINYISIKKNLSFSSESFYFYYFLVNVLRNILLPLPYRKKKIPWLCISHRFTPRAVPFLSSLLIIRLFKSQSPQFSSIL